MDLLNRDDPLFLFAQKLMANVADGSSTSFQAKAAHFRLSPDSGQHRCDKSSDRGEVTVTTEGATWLRRRTGRIIIEGVERARAIARPLVRLAQRLREPRRYLQHAPAGKDASTRPVGRCGIGDQLGDFLKKTKTANEINGTGGRGGIRTHETLAGLPVFKTGALNHSATLP